MHPRNRHQSRYDLKALAGSSPKLKPFIIDKFGAETIDFANPAAVRALNEAILKHDYGIAYWSIPDKFLCPPIPGRADYIHYVADLIKLRGPDVRVLDVGVGANCIYPLIGHREYGWSFVGSDINEEAIASAKKILQANNLAQIIELRKQASPPKIFKGIINNSEKFNLTICNPPFHESASEAAKGTQRKLKNLGHKTQVLNFGGVSNELWCPGGELGFVNEMMLESAEFGDQCDWFSSLISKEENVLKVQNQLRHLKAREVRVINMAQGQKKSRIIAWSWRSIN